MTDKEEKGRATGESASSPELRHDSIIGAVQGEVSAQSPYLIEKVENPRIDGHVTTQELAPRFHALFVGCDRAHGTYLNIDWDRARSDGKLKGDAITKREPVTDDLWVRHLEGRTGIGVIPIRDDSACVWGAIDVDVYADLDPGRVASDIARKGFPLVCCRSKSGGVHLFVFCKTPVPAGQIQEKLRTIAARLGFGTAEIFPKQTIVSGDKDLGSWLNMPYQNAADTKRYGVRPNGDAMTAEEFLTAAESAKVTADWIAQPLPQNTDSLPNGPPCLQHLMELGFPPGTWNVGMFNLGVYCRKAHPDNWKEHLVQLNALNFPVDKWPVSDLDGIIKSLTKTKYAYQCNGQLLAQHCDRTTCRARKYGVGGANALPALTSLSKLCTDPPVWFLEVEGHRIEFTTPELLNPLAFQEKCANHEVIVPVVGRGVWVEHLRPAMASVNRIPVADDGSEADDSSAKGHFLELLEQFCAGRAQAHSREEVLIGKPFSEGGRTYFRFFALVAYLARMGFKDFHRNDLVSVLKGLGATNKQERIGGKVTRVWNVPEFTRNDAPLDLPPGLTDQGGF